MFIKKLLLAVIIACLIPITIACGSQPGEGTKSKATTAMTVLSITDGPVFIRKSGSLEWQDGKAGMVIDAGDKVKTDAKGSATIIFFEGSTLELEGETEISLTELAGKLNTPTTIKIKQEIGTTINRVKKLVDSTSSYEIETPVATAGVRGTIFKVTVAADGTTTVSNEEGSIFVTAQGKTIVLEEKTEVTIEPGQMPGEPKSYTPDVISSVPTSTNTLSASPIAEIRMGYQVIPGYVWKGETVDITYSILNSGNIELSDIFISDTFGTPVYVRGDNNKDNILNPGEIWYFTSHVSTQWDEPDAIDVRAEASGKSPGKSPTAESTINIAVHSFYVIIDSPDGDSRFTSPTQTITGRVGNPAYTEVTIDVNGVLTVVPVVDMKFTGTITLVPGENSVWARVKTSSTRTDSSGLKYYYDP
jgi:hypothetical protein